MRRAQSFYYCVNTASTADRFHLVLLDIFHASMRTNVRIAALQGTELTTAWHLPAAAIIMADSSGPCCKYSGFHCFQTGYGNEKTELEHHRSPDIKTTGTSNHPEFIWSAADSDRERN